MEEGVALGGVLEPVYASLPALAAPRPDRHTSPTNRQRNCRGSQLDSEDFIRRKAIVLVAAVRSHRVLVDWQENACHPLSR
jgi:hypothetical protein